MSQPPDDSPALSRRNLLQASALIGGASLLGAPAVEARTASLPLLPPLVPLPLPPQAPATEGMARVNDVELWYWDTGGKGTPIVLFHPFTGSGKVWSYQQPAFVKAGFRVIGYSRRGHEKSQSGAKDQPGTGSGDLHALLDVLKVDKIHAVASAGGAFVAADYALSHPERLRSIVLACSILGAQGGEFTTMSQALRAPGMESLPNYFRELSPSYRAADPAGTERWKANEETARNKDSVNQPYANKITLDALETIRIPTLLIAGDADLIAPPPIVRLFSQHIRGSQLAVIPEAGHSAYWERPELFNDAVLKFLRKV